ncbi:hypothetical protein [Paenibacillus donghaensis]|nr:hypothetical protein [Paenibacillus donghaensis]
MGKNKLIATSFLMFALLIGCSNTKQATNEVIMDNDSSSESFSNENSVRASKNSSIDVELSISEDVGADNTVTFNGATNLPDGMELMLSLKSDSSFYSAQDNVSVKDGSFISGSFSNNGNGLESGEYTLEATSPTANVQPPNVKELIGDNGSNLKGATVKSDAVWGNTVSVTKNITVGSTSSVYTKEELQSDSKAPSTNPEDYDSDGQFVPENGISDEPEDYNFDGEYKPVDEMTQEEIQAELEEMLGGSLGN